jgi:hypothetical protein
VHRVLAIAHLTVLEARRRRIVPAAVLGGLAFLAVYGVALTLIDEKMPDTGLQRQGVLLFITLAGLYVANFLTIAAAVLLPLDTLSGEIASGTMQTLASKPVHRAEIVLGKWLAYFALVTGYLLLTAGGLLAIVRVVTGFSPPNIATSLLLLLLGATLMLTLTLAGGARLTTVTNGIMAFAFYGVAFIGGWVEQIGALAAVDTARYIGTAISLVSPVDTLWRRVAYDIQPALLRGVQIGPLGTPNVPSNLMIVWAGGFCVLLFAIALREFRRRAL